MEAVCEKYSKMGIKGWKIDFMDYDDQLMVQFYRRAAETAAKYGMMCDFHGAYKPTGLQRTWPNVVNFEGVHGLEQLKWEDFSDQVTYDTQIPFIRQVAGPLDYTQGAMRNATRGNFRPVNSEPMSQGTRCRQLALYMIFESPLNMLCDTPTQYMKEAECTRFIADVPTVWDETVPICGKVGEYVATARRKGSVWYIGAITNWTARDLELDLGAVLGGGTWKCESFSDGANASRLASDYRHSTATVSLSEPLKVHLAPGGGWAAVLSR
jgi:alpha-glucosidase